MIVHTPYGEDIECDYVEVNTDVLVLFKDDEEIDRVYTDLDGLYDDIYIR